MTAIPSRSRSCIEACSMASLITALNVSMCCREASSGTMPPYWACMSIWVATTFEWMVRPSSMTAAAVSSQDVSMPRIFISSYEDRWPSLLSTSASRAMPSRISSGWL